MRDAAHSTTPPPLPLAVGVFPTSLMLVSGGHIANVSFIASDIECFANRAYGRNLNDTELQNVSGTRTAVIGTITSANHVKNQNGIATSLRDMVL